MKNYFTDYCKNVVSISVYGFSLTALIGMTSIVCLTPAFLFMRFVLIDSMNVLYILIDLIVLIALLVTAFLTLIWMTDKITDRVTPKAIFKQFSRFFEKDMTK